MYLSILGCFNNTTSWKNNISKLKLIFIVKKTKTHFLAVSLHQMVKLGMIPRYRHRNSAVTGGIGGHNTRARLRFSVQIKGLKDRVLRRRPQPLPSVITDGGCRLEIFPLERRFPSPLADVTVSSHVICAWLGEALLGVAHTAEDFEKLVNLVLGHFTRFPSDYSGVAPSFLLCRFHHGHEIRLLYEGLVQWCVYIYIEIEKEVNMVGDVMKILVNDVIVCVTRANCCKERLAVFLWGFF